MGWGYVGWGEGHWAGMGHDGLGYAALGWDGVVLVLVVMVARLSGDAPGFVEI